MIEVVYVEFRDRAAFPYTEWRLIPPLPDMEKPQKETVLLSFLCGNTALKAIDDALYQVNGRCIYTPIMNKSQHAHQVPPAFCPFTFKIINHVKANFQNYVVTKTFRHSSPGFEKFLQGVGNTSTRF